MGVNNFKRLEDDMEMENLSVRTEGVRNNLESNLGSMRFVTNILELYIPAVIDLFLGFTGGRTKPEKPNKNKYPDLS